MPNRLTTTEFVQKAIQIHGDKYDYSHVIYTNNRTKITIYCKIHNKYFTQSPNGHLDGSGCPDCGEMKRAKSYSLSQHEFLQKCREAHGDRYDYTSTIYVKMHVPVIIICRKHGKFSQSAAKHSRGAGCQKCNGSSQPSRIEFITKANSLYSSAYNYDKFIYKNSKTPGIITCTKHNVDFETSPTKHLHQKSICPICRFELKPPYRHYKSNTTDMFISSAKAIHGDKYDYSRVIYKNNHTKVKIICNHHNKEFLQGPHSHLSGIGCPLCGTERVANKNRKHTWETVQKRFISAHADKFDYSLVEFRGMNKNVTIICKQHNVTFLKSPRRHLEGSGCPHCEASIGELRVAEYLTNNNIKHIPQKRFDGCFDKMRLPFDFYLIDYNVCIEYDGQLHYHPWNSSDRGMQNFKTTIHHDEIKTKYCKEHGIHLLRIPYWDKNTIPSIIDQFIAALKE